MLYGRDAEQTRIAELVDGARAGRGGSLVLRGEAGTGKSALTRYAASLAEGVTVLRAVGVESESELPYAALHMLLRPVLDRLDAVPDPQAVALRGAFGLVADVEVNRFAVGLATLTLLSEAASDRPILCIVDDAQWIDLPSLDALRFAARRLAADRVALLAAARPTTRPVLDGLPDTTVTDLDATAAARLLADSTTLPEAVRRRVVADSHGNPLALTELARHRGTEPTDGETHYPRSVRDAFLADLAHCDADTVNLLTVAAVSGSTDLDVVWRVCDELGVAESALDTAIATGLITVEGDRIEFRHPLIRSAVRQRATAVTRRGVHRILSLVYDEFDEPDRRAWHAAAATVGTDDTIAAALADSAARAVARGGQAAAVSILERAAELSGDPAERAVRLIDAAETAAAAGRPDRAARLADTAAPLSTAPAVLARITELRAEAEALAGSTRTAHELLTSAADTVAATDPGRAVVLLTHVVDLALRRGEPDRIERAHRRMRRLDPADGPTRAVVTACGGLVDLLDGRPETGTPAVRRFAAALAEVPAAPIGARQFAATLSTMVGDVDAAAEVTGELIARCRSTGTLGWLPSLHALHAENQLYRGRFADAAGHAADGAVVADDLGQHRAAARLAAIATVAAAVTGDTATTDRTPADDTAWATATLSWADSLTDLAAGRFAEAADRWDAVIDAGGRHTTVARWWAPDQVEAAIRAGRPDAAVAVLAWWRGRAEADGSARSRALLARCEALTGPDDTAGDRFAAALDHDEEPYPHARTGLLYGEWLRRRREHTAARAPLRAALETFTRLGAHRWADRARGELRATGETRLRRDTGAASRHLTPQELQVVRLAATGATNRQIGAELFLSPRTVGHHLYKAFPKLGVANRAELAARLAEPPR